MDEDKPPCLKRFGFLPEQEKVKHKSRRRIGRQKSERHYVRDSRGVYLTTREAEASWLIARGCTIREVAQKMSLSPRTVEFYLGNVRHKLGAQNKNELLQILYDNDFFQQLQ